MKKNMSDKKELCYGSSAAAAAAAVSSYTIVERQGDKAARSEKTRVRLRSDCPPSRSANTTARPNITDALSTDDDYHDEGKQ